MAYCDADDVRTRLPAMPLDGENDAFDTRVTKGIAAADGQINAAFRKLGATVPINPVDPLVTAISSALAAAFCLDGGFSGGGEDNPTLLADSLRKWAENQLKMICDGDLLIPGVNEGLASGDDGTVYIAAQHSDIDQVQELDCWDVMGG